MLEAHRYLAQHIKIECVLPQKPLIEGSNALESLRCDPKFTPLSIFISQEFYDFPDFILRKII